MSLEQQHNGHRSAQASSALSGANLKASSIVSCKEHSTIATSWHPHETHAAGLHAPPAPRSPSNRDLPFPGVIVVTKELVKTAPMRFTSSQCQHALLIRPLPLSADLTCAPDNTDT